jgi:ribonuclease PH
MKVFWFGCVALAVFTIAVLSPSLALAQTVVDDEPLVDFSNVFDSLANVVTTVVVGAIGIGLAVWATRYVFSIVRSMGRG